MRAPRSFNEALADWAAAVLLPCCSVTKKDSKTLQSILEKVYLDVQGNRTTGYSMTTEDKILMMKRVLEEGIKILEN